MSAFADGEVTGSSGIELKAVNTKLFLYLNYSNFSASLSACFLSSS
ncbi:MAG: hypothetical protein JKX76_07610 [Colwellia sp.]|nr:hypothetical protein [Colwellia sp.]